jgi:hypothetical protein
MEWFNGARWRLSLSHCFEGLLIQIPVALLFGLTAGTVAVIAWYWSREAQSIAVLIRQWSGQIFRYAVATLRADSDPSRKRKIQDAGHDYRLNSRKAEIVVLS